MATKAAGSAGYNDQSHHIESIHIQTWFATWPHPLRPSHCAHASCWPWHPVYDRQLTMLDVERRGCFSAGTAGIKGELIRYPFWRECVKGVELEEI